MANDIMQLSRQLPGNAPSQAPVVDPSNEISATESAPAQGQELPPGGSVSPPESTASVPANTDELSATVEQINEFVQSVQRDLRFSVDEDSGRVIVKVLDSSTQEVIRQIPPENVMALAENLESLRGVLFSAQV